MIVSFTSLRKFVLHHDGGKSKDVDGYISLYLMIAETDKLCPGWVVSVDFQLFIYDQIGDKYHVFRDSKVAIRHFQAMQMELGFPRLLSFKIFNEYLFNDTCVFGAEVFLFKVRGVYCWWIKWYLELYPKGDRRVRDENLYLWLNDSNKTLTRKIKLCAQFTLLMKNQQNGAHMTCKWFSTAAEMAWGCLKFMSLKNLRDPYKG
ncbi:hypothetical protein SLE2022_022210 [Rubroshorea leprosula]